MSIRRHIKHLATHLSTRANYDPFNSVLLSSENLLNNIRVIRENNPTKNIIPVLKGNAYGHGITEIASILNKVNLDLIAVDGYFEARQIMDITRHRILVMGAIKSENASLLNTKKCSFVVQDIQGLKAFAALKKPVNIHLELNTGMQRLGLTQQELKLYLRYIQNNPSLHLEGVMSHLADADNNKNNFTVSQQGQFTAMFATVREEGFTPEYVHLAQTAGSTKTNLPETNMIRLGIGLYGINPLEDTDRAYSEFSELKPVLELRSTIIKVHELKKGDRVSYNGIFTAQKHMKIGVLPLGYYEGYPRELSNTGIVTYKDCELPVVGRICMNHTMISLENSNIKVGSQVTLVSQNNSLPNSVLQLCNTYNLFSYSLLTGINQNIRRIIN